MWSTVRWGRKWGGRSTLNSQHASCKQLAVNDPNKDRTGVNLDYLTVCDFENVSWFGKDALKRETMEVEETGEKRTSWYDTFCIYFASTLGCSVTNWCWKISVLINRTSCCKCKFSVCHQHNYRTRYIFVRLVEQKLLLMYFARARRINKLFKCTLPT